MVNFIVGALAFLVFSAALYKSYQDMKHNKCSCGGCSKKPNQVVQIKL